MTVFVTLRKKGEFLLKCRISVCLLNYELKVRELKWKRRDCVLVPSVYRSVSVTLSLTFWTHRPTITHVILHQFFLYSYHCHFSYPFKLVFKCASGQVLQHHHCHLVYRKTLEVWLNLGQYLDESTGKLFTKTKKLQMNNLDRLLGGERK